MARPKTKEHKKEILRQISLGIPIQEVLNEDNPNHVPVLWEDVVSWFKTDEVFRGDWEQARVYGADYLADDMLGLVKLLKDNPKNAPAVKAAMDILKWQTMVRNSKYSERIVQETKTTGPQDPEKVRTEIERLKKELRLVKT